MVQEPRVDGHSTHETPVQDQPWVEVCSDNETPVQDQPQVEVRSAHEIPVPEASADVETPVWGAWPERTQGPGGSGGGDGGDEFTDSEGDVQVDGDTVYKRGSTCFPVVPATCEQRPVIKPEGDR